MSEVYYTDEEGNPHRRPRWWIGYVAGSVLVVLGILIPCVGTGLVAVAVLPEQHAALHSAGAFTASVKEAGTMVIWVEQPLDELHGAGHPVVPNDIAATVNGPDGKAIMTRRPSERLENTTGLSGRSGALLFDAPVPGTYDLEVKGTLTPTQRIAVGPDRTTQVAAAGLGFLAGVVIGGLFLLGGLATLIVTGVRQARS